MLALLLAIILTLTNLSVFVFVTFAGFEATIADISGMSAPLTLNPKVYIFVLVPVVIFNRISYVLIYYINRKFLKKDIYSFIKYSITYYTVLFYSLTIYNLLKLLKLSIKFTDVREYGYSVYFLITFLISLCAIIVLARKIIFKNKFDYTTETSILLPRIFKNLDYYLYRFEKRFTENFTLQRKMFYIEIFLCIFLPVISCVILIHILFFGMNLRIFFYLLPLNFIGWSYKIIKSFLLFQKDNSFCTKINELRLKDITSKEKKKHSIWKTIALETGFINYDRLWYGSTPEFEKNLLSNHLIVKTWYLQMEEKLNNTKNTLSLFNLIACLYIVVELFIAIYLS